MTDKDAPDPEEAKFGHLPAVNDDDDDLLDGPAGETP
jgi:hypothetical protein